MRHLHNLLNNPRHNNNFLHQFLHLHNPRNFHHFLHNFLHLHLNLLQFLHSHRYLHYFLYRSLNYLDIFYVMDHWFLYLDQSCLGNDFVTPTLYLDYFWDLDAFDCHVVYYCWHLNQFLLYYRHFNPTVDYFLGLFHQWDGDVIHLLNFFNFGHSHKFLNNLLHFNQFGNLLGYLNNFFNSLRNLHNFFHNILNHNNFFDNPFNRLRHISKNNSLLLKRLRFNNFHNNLLNNFNRLNFLHLNHLLHNFLNINRHLHNLLNNFLHRNKFLLNNLNLLRLINNFIDNFLHLHNLRINNNPFNDFFHLNNFRHLDHSLYNFLYNSRNFNNSFIVCRNFYYFLYYVVDDSDSFYGDMYNSLNLLHTRHLNHFLYNSLHWDNLRHFHNLLRDFLHNLLDFNYFRVDFEHFKNIIHIDNIHNLLSDHCENRLIHFQNHPRFNSNFLQLLQQSLDQHSQMILHSFGIGVWGNVDVLNADCLRDEFYDLDQSLYLIHFNWLDYLCAEECHHSGVQILNDCGVFLWKGF